MERIQTKAKDDCRTFLVRDLLSGIDASVNLHCHRSATDPMPDLDPRLMRAFLAIYDARSVSGAARAEGVSQPTMSDHLRRLREHFGDRLFVRASASLCATPRAEEVRPIIRQVVNALSLLSQGPAAWNPIDARRTFRIGTSSYVQAIVLPQLDKILRVQAPGIMLDITTPQSPDSDLEMVPLHAANPEHRRQQLFTDELACAVDPDMASTIDLETFCEFEHLVLAAAPAPLHDSVDQALAGIGRSRRVGMIITHLVGLAPLLTAQRRLAIMPARLAPMLVNWLVGRPLPVTVSPFGIVMTWPQHLDGDPAHRWMREAVAAAARAMPPYVFG